MVSNTNIPIIVSMGNDNYNKLHDEQLKYADSMLKGLNDNLESWKNEVLFLEKKVF